eukprot:scaffold156598_cov16-Tisochrysis_lutea.AAC.1
MGFSCVKHDRDSRHFLLQTASLGRRRASTTFGQLRLSPFRTYSSRTYDGQIYRTALEKLGAGGMRGSLDALGPPFQNFCMGHFNNYFIRTRFPELEPSQFGTLFGLWIKGGWVNVHDYKLVHMRMGVGCKGCGGKVQHINQNLKERDNSRCIVAWRSWEANGCRIISGAHWYPYYQGRATERAIEGFLLGPRLPA